MSVRAPGANLGRRIVKMRRLPPLNALRAFEATARLSSMTRAAQELGVTHSAISQQVRQLEDHMGRRLFDRPGRRVEPTPAGQALLQDVTAAFDQIARTSERLSHRGAKRVLTVSAPACLALRWLIPRMTRFQRLHPDFEIRVETSMSASTVRPHPAFAAIIRCEEQNWPDYVCRPLLEGGRTVVMAPLLAERVTRPAELAQLTPLHTRQDPDEWARWFEQTGDYGQRARDGHIFEDLALALEAAATGLGAVICPLPLVAKDLAEGRLVAPFPELMLPGPRYHLLYQREDALQRGPRELLRWLSQESLAPAAASRGKGNAILGPKARLMGAPGRRE